MFDIQVVDSKARLSNWEMHLQVKYTLAVMPEQLQDTETEVQMGYIGGQNEQLEDLRGRLWD